MELLDTLVRRIARKVEKCGRATVQAPCKDAAQAWANHFNETGKYLAIVREGVVDANHSWLIEIEASAVSAANTPIELLTLAPAGT